MMSQRRAGPRRNRLAARDRVTVSGPDGQDAYDGGIILSILDRIVSHWLALLVGVDALLRWQGVAVERLAQAAGLVVGVDPLGGLRAGVPQDVLDLGEIGAAIEQQAGPVV